MAEIFMRSILEITEGVLEVEERNTLSIVRDFH
jgi:hypothetical protein